MFQAVALIVLECARVFIADVEAGRENLSDGTQFEGDSLLRRESQALPLLALEYARQKERQVASQASRLLPAHLSMKRQLP
jgi:hypothetical protein